MLQHGACQQQNKRASDTAQWLEQSQGHFACLFVCCEKKVRLSEVKSLNLSLVCLRVFASFIGIAGAARTPSVGRRARTRLVVVSLNFRTPRGTLGSSPRQPDHKTTTVLSITRTSGLCGIWVSHSGPTVEIRMHDELSPMLDTIKFLGPSLPIIP